MTSEQAAVSITLESESDGHRQAQQFAGQWYCKGGTIFVRYEESDEMHGAIRTMIRWRDGELQITRRGGVESEQRFVAGASLIGRYRSPHTRFIMEIETTRLEVRQEGLPFQAEWHYKLYVNEQQPVSFKVRLTAAAIA